ncbi:hypothetical protein L9G16_20190, partial [Shewanella sp. A25]|nr:hypothetical protein [Shewanella shenzhenensis]
EPVFVGRVAATPLTLLVADGRQTSVYEQGGNWSVLSLLLPLLATPFPLSLFLFFSLFLCSLQSLYYRLTSV